MNDAKKNAVADVTDELVEAWRDIPTAVISDENDCKGVLNMRIRPLTPGRSFVARAVTVRTSRTASDAPQRALAALRPGDAIVMDGSAHPDTAIWGGNLVAVAISQGASAIVVDGNVRDIRDLQDSGLAIYARNVTPAGIPWGGDVNEQITCGGIEVAPGALLVGDDDGVIVVPVEGNADLLARCKQRIAAESAHQKKAKAS